MTLITGKIIAFFVYCRSVSCREFGRTLIFIKKEKRSETEKYSRSDKKEVKGRPSKRKVKKVKVKNKVETCPCKPQVALVMAVDVNIQ